MDMSANRPRIKALVTDLDDTLWNWFETWYAAFTALMDGVCRISGLSMEQLIPEVKDVHELHRTTEYTFLLQEIPSLTRLHAKEEIRDIYKEAIEAARKARENTLRTYPGVLETLDAVRDAGALVVAYTESQAYWTARRLKRTNLDRTINYLYSAPDHDMPEGLDLQEFRSMPTEYYQLRVTKHRHTPRGVIKPSPEVLKSILSEIGVSPSEAAYVGDDHLKDIVMAQQSGVLDILASHERNDEEYELLRRVTWWRLEDVEKQRRLLESLRISGKSHIRPTLEIASFVELLTKLEFVPYG
jgi:FMN phosphatase YigB (HAD superfamily)